MGLILGTCTPRVKKNDLRPLFFFPFLFSIVTNLTGPVDQAPVQGALVFPHLLAALQTSVLHLR